MANLCIKTPSSASLVLIFQLLVLRPRPIAQYESTGNIPDQRDTTACEVWLVKALGFLQPSKWSLAPGMLGVE